MVSFARLVASRLKLVMTFQPLAEIWQVHVKQLRLLPHSVSLWSYSAIWIMAHIKNITKLMQVLAHLL